jgi:hypothetical protein
MTKYVVKRTGELLFPHLGHDQRKRRMTIILVVAMISLSSAGALAAWMTAADTSVHVSLLPGVSLWQK